MTATLVFLLTQNVLVVLRWLYNASCVIVEAWCLWCPFPQPIEGFHSKPRLSNAWIREDVIDDLFPSWCKLY
jgi:hypothetical protein